MNTVKGPFSRRKGGWYGEREGREGGRGRKGDGVQTWIVEDSKGEGRTERGQCLSFHIDIDSLSAQRPVQMS